MIDLNGLWQRERKRRYALWDLEKLQPGSDRAIKLIAILDEIERQDRDDPIGDAVAMSVDELREVVPETEIEGISGSHFVVVRPLFKDRGDCRQRSWRFGHNQQEQGVHQYDAYGTHDT